MKTNLDKLYKTNPQLEQKGINMEIAPGVIFVVSRYSAKSTALKEAMEKETRPYLRQIQNKSLPEEKAMEINIRAFVHGCVHDWKGVEINGEFPPFSKEACIDLFLEMPDLAQKLQDEATNMRNYLEDLGNS